MLPSSLKQDQSVKVLSQKVATQIQMYSVKNDQHGNLFGCIPFDVNSKTTNQTALAVSLVCQKDQAHETAVALRLIVSSLWLQSAN